MQPNYHTRQTPRSRRLFVWTLVTLGAMAFAAGCAKTQQPLGTCTNPSDTTIVLTDVTQQDCTNKCPNCTWTANES